MRKAIVAVVLVALCVGCSGVQMSAEYSQLVEMSAINVAELNTRCQDGDAEACKEGLRVASETLNRIVDALHGVDNE